LHRDAAMMCVARLRLRWMGANGSYELMEHPLSPFACIVAILSRDRDHNNIVF
jgi:hypothetical protein